MSTNPPAGRFAAWTPFLRRFTDERANDLHDTIALHQEVTSAWRRSSWATPTALDKVARYLLNHLEKVLVNIRNAGIPEFWRDDINDAIKQVLTLEAPIF